MRFIAIHSFLVLMGGTFVGLEADLKDTITESHKASLVMERGENPSIHPSGTPSSSTSTGLLTNLSVTLSVGPVALIGTGCVPPVDPAPIKLSSGFKWPHAGPDNTGIYSTLMQEMFCRIGRQVIVEMVPAARSIAQANLGVFFGEGPRRGNIIYRYENLILLTPPLYDLKFMAFSLKPFPDVKDYADLAAYRVTTVIGRKGIERNLDGVMDNYLRVTTETDAFKLLMVGRTDFVVLDDFSGMYAASEAGVGTVHKVELEEHSFNLFVHNSNRAMLPALSKALIAMQEEGTVQQVINYYLKPENRPE